MNKQVVITLIIAVLLIVSTIILSNSNSNGNAIPLNNVYMEGEKQIIEIHAKGGYLPRFSSAKAGIPTIIRFNTNGTFDCSSAVRIPSLGVSEFLPQSGTKDINVGTPQIGTLHGSCSMGMYPFEVEFKS